MSPRCPPRYDADEILSTSVIALPTKLDDTSPQFTYTSASNGWINNHTGGELHNPNLFWIIADTSNRLGCSPVLPRHLSRNVHQCLLPTLRFYVELMIRLKGDTLTFTFNGTAVYMYGAKRPNHGLFSGTSRTPVRRCSR